MAETKHTPGPWEYTYGVIRQVRDCDLIVAKPDFFCPRTNPIERDANAEFIVQACNSHDALVEALKRIATEADYTNPESMVQVARAALKAVGIE